MWTSPLSQLQGNPLLNVCICVRMPPGANDVANAIGSFAAALMVYNTMQVPSSNSEVYLWILALGGSGIVVGLATYGYNSEYLQYRGRCSREFQPLKSSRSYSCL